MASFNSNDILIKDFCGRLNRTYCKMFDHRYPEHAHLIENAAIMSLEIIANSDALYHTMEHTMMVTLVGQEILRGKLLKEGSVSSQDWVQFIISLLCHDIGYVRGICQGDNQHQAVIDDKGNTIVIPEEATDVFLAPYHIERGKLFVQTRFGNNSLIDADVITTNIENTRFPVPLSSDKKDGKSYAGLVRAADLIGQLADPDYIRKLPALFYEFTEIGADKTMGYQSFDDLKVNYPDFFWAMVSPHIPDAIAYLQITREGRLWIAGLYNHIFSEEHQEEKRAHREY